MEPRPDDASGTPQDPAQATVRESPRAHGQSEGRSTAASDELVPGAVIDEFVVMRSIGSGASGRVYVARDAQLGRRVALKLVRNVEKDGLDQELVLREARLLAHVAHPSFVAVHRLGTWRSHRYLVLEHVEGRTLQSRLRESGPGSRLPTLQAARIAYELAEGVRAAHAVGVLHRDLKPANVMIDPDGRVRILDFGIGVLRGASRSGPVAADEPTFDPFGVVGTPAYMAPEQWARETGPPADVWAIGTMLHEMLCGVRPYIGRGDAIEPMVTSADPVPFAPWLSDVPEELATLVRACLDKRPEARPTAAALAEALSSFLGRPVGATQRDSPFRGLSAFTEREAGAFYGRDHEVEQAMEVLREWPSLVLMGPSGSGKSSLARAGVLPRLSVLGELRVCRMRPGRRPFLALGAALLAEESTGSGPSRERASSASVLGCETAEALAIAIASAPSRLVVDAVARHRDTGVVTVLVVDQLEELHTIAEPLEPGVERRFLELLVQLVADATDAIRLIATVRDDFVSKMRWPPSGADVLRRILLVSAPEGAALRQTITAPVLAVGYSFDDPSLPDRLLADAASSSAPLPLLQFAMSELWEERDREARVLRAESYVRAGSLAGMLAQHAERCVAGLSPSEVEIVRDVFFSLCTSARTNRAQSWSRLVGSDPAVREPIIEKLVRARLLVTRAGFGDALDREVEMAHESLTSTWSRLARWLDDTVAVRKQVEEVEQAAALWHERARPDEALWSGSLLAEARPLRTRETSRLSGVALAFLDRAVAREERARRRRRLIGALAVLALVAITLVSVQRERLAQAAEGRARAAMERAEEDREVLLIANARQRFADGDPLGARARLRAVLESRDHLAARVLVDEWRRAPVLLHVPRTEIPYTVVMDDENRVAFVGTQSSSLARIDLRTGRVDELEGHTDQVPGVARAPGGALASIDITGELRVWDGPESRVLARIPGSSGAVVALDDETLAVGRTLQPPVILSRTSDQVLAPTTSLAASRAITAAGGLLWLGAVDGRVLAVRPRTGEIVREVAVSFPPVSLAVAPDLTRVAIGSDVDTTGGTVAVHDVITGARLGAWSPGTGCRNVVWIGSDTVLAACASQLHVLDLASGSVFEHTVDGSEVTGLAVGATTVVAATMTGVGLLSIDALRRPVRPTLPTGIATSVGVSPEHDLALVGVSRGLRAFRLSSGRPFATVPIVGDRVGARELVVTTDAAFASLGREVVRLELPDLRRTHMLSGNLGDVDGLAVRGDAVIAAGRDGRVVRWDLSSELAVEQTLVGPRVRDLLWLEGERWLALTAETLVLGGTGLERTSRPLPTHMLSLSHDPRGGFLLSSADGRVFRLAAPDAELLEVVSVGVRVYSARATASGTIALACADRLARLVRTDGSVVALAGHRGEVNAVAFSPDGALLVSAADDATLRAWDVATARPIWASTGYLPLGPDGVVRPAQGDEIRRASDSIVCRWSRGTLELVRGDAVLASRSLPNVSDVEVHASGCAALSRGRLTVLEADDRSDVALDEVTAIAGSPRGLLVAHAQEIVRLDAAWRTSVLVPTTRPPTALVDDGTHVWWGDALGRVHREDGVVVLSSPGSAVAVSHLAPGPAGTLVVGGVDGQVGLWDVSSGERMRAATAHGAVVDSLRIGAELHVISELADELTLDVTATHGGWCAALRELWAFSPLVWRDGGLVDEPAPDGHPCTRATDAPPAIASP